MHFCKAFREITHVAAVKTLVRVVTMCRVCSINSSEVEPHFGPFRSLSTAWSRHVRCTVSHLRHWNNSPATLLCSSKQQAGGVSCWKRQISDLSCSVRTAKTYHRDTSDGVDKINVKDNYFNTNSRTVEGGAYWYSSPEKKKERKKKTRGQINTRPQYPNPKGVKEINNK